MSTLWDLLEPLKRTLAGLLSPPRSQRQPPSRVQPPKGRPRARPAQRPAKLQDAAAPSLFAPPKSERTRRPAQLATPPAESMDARYERVASEMLATHNVRVRKWRTSMSGVAWRVSYRDGRTVNLIEAPKPRGPMSMAVFLHEIGHHALGIGAFKPRCLEEYHAWMFALRQMEIHGFTVTEGVKTRVRRSLEYAVGKAARRGIKSLPAELEPYIPARYRRSANDL